MANGRTQVMQKVLKKIESLENRMERMEKTISLNKNIASEVELEFVARKIAKEEAEMKSKGKKYLTEEQVRKKYGF